MAYSVLNKKQPRHTNELQILGGKAEPVEVAHGPLPPHGGCQGQMGEQKQGQKSSRRLDEN